MCAAHSLRRTQIYLRELTMVNASAIDRRLVITGALGLALAGQAAARTAAKARLRVLLIDGCSNHDWQLTTKIVLAILKPTGLFDVTVSTSPPTAQSPGWDQWRPDFKAHDAVIQTYNDY